MRAQACGRRHAHVRRAPAWRRLRRQMSQAFASVRSWRWRFAEDHIVAMHQLGAARVAQDGGDLAALLADDTGCVGPCIGDKSAAKLTAVEGADDDGIAALKRALQAGDASGQ